MTLALEAVDLVHRYGAVTALDGVSLQVPEGGIVAVVGESGSGKTTLLRAFNRLVQPAGGTVRVHGRDVRDAPPEALRRRIGYVPQTGGLLPHWNIRRNVALVPMLAGEAQPQAAADAAMALVGLPVREFGARFPHELSGGQRQRAALARALAAQQAIVLLDEPFGALDAISRSEVHTVFESLRVARGFSALLVTHDLAEAARLADVIAVMRAGRIVQVDTMGALRSRPATPYVAELIGRADATARSVLGLEVGA